MRFQFLMVVSSLFFAFPVVAKGPKFSPIPADQTGGKPTGLELRIVRYDGSVNGVLEVEVKNPLQEPVQFSAKGLYFVPQGDADKAPQRLGAVGPFNLHTDQGWQRRESTTVAPGSVIRLKLDVYCIDSHRGSPSSSTDFRLAKDRVPKKVYEVIDRHAGKAAARLGGVSAPAAKSTVQSQVWQVRDDDWVKLDGEGKQEAGKKK
ncbi:MAG TPA: hypothetical protein VN914_21570 [Polyangia bacterium]|nr:hypothetical protein [Polyangia bacterium]